MRSPILVPALSDLLIKVHVLGYRTMGESIVVVFISASTRKVLYSMVIDSFERKDENKNLLNSTSIILDAYKISCLDMLCWSHPDADHSRGLGKLIEKYCASSTRILVPYGFHDPDFRNIRHNKDDRKFILKLLETNRPDAYGYSPVSVASGEMSRVDTLRFLTLQHGVGERPFEITIDALSPVTGLMSEKIFTNRQIDKNELAIVLAISIGDNRLIFASDILNDEIKYLNFEYLDLPQFVKVPHHGSSSSDKFLHYCSMDKNSTVACITSFDRHGLPEKRVVDEYLYHCGQVDFTGDGHPGVWGEVIYEFDFFGSKSMCTSHKGNARQLHT